MELVALDQEFVFFNFLRLHFGKVFSPDGFTLFALGGDVNFKLLGVDTVFITQEMVFKDEGEVKLAYFVNTQLSSAVFQPFVKFVHQKAKITQLKSF